MNAIVVFKDILSKIESNSIAYMVVGSIASSLYGEPRLTKDMDLVIEIKPQDAARLEALFPVTEFYCPPRDVIADAILHRGHFNVIHHASGLKIDFMVRKETPHAVEEFKRRSRVQLLPDLEAFVAAPEDVILKKMQFYQEGGSEKHLADIRGILTQTSVDRAYLDRWVATLTLQDVWARLA